MASEPKLDPQTTIQARTPPPGTDRLFLLVLGDTAVTSQPLPETGDVIIGRSERCDVRIQDESISRQHAILRLGVDITVEDLGSVNGTMVGDVRVDKGMSQALSINEAFTIGTVTMVVQRRVAAVRSRRLSRRLWSHDFFEGRVAEECARAEHSSSCFAIIRVRLSGEAALAQVQKPLATVLREIDVIGQYGPHEYEVLLIDASLEEAKIVEDRLQTALIREDLSGDIGLACFPQDGRSADKLIACARPRSLSGGVEEHSVVVQGAKMGNLYRLAERVAKGTINILILGETGVGKQVLAEKIHQFSPRKGKPFLELNCSGFSETLLESELFGHEKGAFTGATTTKPGLLETAHGGTVFLDEIGDMALTLQAKLLRVIENRMVMRVGGLKAKEIDVRFLAATNRELEADVMSGVFRQDLYFRINGVTLTIPPLRERREEIAGLAETFAAEAAAAMNAARPRIATSAMTLLENYSWPGNIRELRNVMERAVLLCIDDEITAAQMPVEKMERTFATAIPTARPWQSSAPVASPARDQGTNRQGNVRKETDSEKRERILEALMACGGNNTEAAKILGVSRRTLGKWLEALDIPRPRKKSRGTTSDS